MVSTPWATKGVGKQPADDFVLQGEGAAVGSDTRQAEMTEQTNSDEKTIPQSADQTSGDTTSNAVDSGDTMQGTEVLCANTPGQSETRVFDSRGTTDQTTGQPTVQTSMPSSSTTVQTSMPGQSTMPHIPSDIGEKRPASELIVADPPMQKKTRTIMHTTITPVKSVMTKRGKTVQVECNEETDCLIRS